MPDIDPLEREFNDWYAEWSRFTSQGGPYLSALAAWQVCRSRFMETPTNVTERGQLRDDVQRLRRALWLYHGHVGLYGDDDEMVCNHLGGIVDFKRDPVLRLLDHVDTMRFTP